MKDFIANVSDIRGTMRLDGPFQSPAVGAGEEAVESFIDEMEQSMHDYLAELRRERAA